MLSLSVEYQTWLDYDIWLFSHYNLLFLLTSSIQLQMQIFIFCDKNDEKIDLQLKKNIETTTMLLFRGTYSLLAVSATNT